MNIKVYLLGDKIPKFYREAIAEYDKRLSRYCKIQLIEAKNRDTLLKMIPANSYKILISPQGTSLSSETLADKISQYALSGKSDLTIVIGADPFDCDEHLRLSAMDMESGLLVTILFEQIYRAYRIINMHAYHK